MEIVSDKNNLEQIWNSLVMPDTLYDEYTFRIAFFDDRSSDLFCLVDDLEQTTALLPLERSKETGQLRFIGTPFLERNRGFNQTEAAATLIKLYKDVSQAHPCVLDDISANDPISSTEHVIKDEEAFQYDLTKHNVMSLDDLIKSVSTRLAERLSTARSYLDNSVLLVEPSLNKAITELKAISFERFGSDSWLENQTINQAVHDLPDLKTTHPVTVVPRLLMTKDGKCVGGHIGVTHKDTYYTLFSAARYVDPLPEIGTLVHLAGFMMTLKHNCRHLDTGLGDCGWKTRWGFDAIPQYKFTN